MGPNFYIQELSIDLESDERVFDTIHIGKRSGGWVFMFNGQHFKTVQTWRDMLTTGLASNMSIIDEYDRTYTADEFLAEIEKTKLPWGPRKLIPKTARDKSDGTEWLDEGFSFYSGEFC